MPKPIDWFRKTFYREPWWAEFWAAMGAILWAGWALGFPDREAEITAFRVVQEVAPWYTWMIIALIGGAGQLIAILIDHKTFRRVFAFVMGWFWTFLVLSLVQTVPITPSTALYMMAAGMNYVSVWRMA